MKKLKIRDQYSDPSVFVCSSGNGKKTLVYKKVKKGDLRVEPLKDKNGKLVYENRYKLIQQFRAGCDYKTMIAQANGDPDNLDKVLNSNEQGTYADLRNAPKNVNDLIEQKRQALEKAYKELYEAQVKQQPKQEVKQEVKQESEKVEK